MTDTAPSAKEIRAFMSRHRSVEKPWRSMRVQDLAELLTRELRRMGMPEDALPVAETTVTRYRIGARSPDGIHAAALRRVMDRLDEAAAKRAGVSKESSDGSAS